MIGVTERAKQELKRILVANVDNPQAGLRLTAGELGQLGLGIDTEMPGDTVVEYEGSKVLMVEQKLADRLQGISLDVEDTPEGPRLVIVKES
jgi:Fe-S cluster assembly iron-binding protein IscA